MRFFGLDVGWYIHTHTQDIPPANITDSLWMCGRLYWNLTINHLCHIYNIIIEDGGLMSIFSCGLCAKKREIMWKRKVYVTECRINLKLVDGLPLLSSLNSLVIEYHKSYMPYLFLFCHFYTTHNDFNFNSRTSQTFPSNKFSAHTQNHFHPCSYRLPFPYRFPWKTISHLTRVFVW